MESQAVVEQQQGVKEISEVVLAVGSIIDAIKQSKSDGKVDFNDLQFLLPVAPKVGAALENIKGVVPEFKDLSPEEGEQLIALVIAQTGGVKEDVQLKITKVLLAIKANYEAYKAFA